MIAIRTSKTKIQLILLLVTFSLISFAQKQQDSLLTIWNNTKLTDSIRAHAYNKLIFEFYTANKPDSAYVMIKDLEKFVISREIDNQLGNVLLTLGNTEMSIGNIAKATDSYIQALTLFQNNNDKKGEASALYNIGRCFKRSWDFDKALKYYHQSLDINTLLKDSLQIAINLTGIGNIYSTRFKSDEAIAYYKRSIEISNKIKDPYGKAITNLNLGNVLLQKKDYSGGLKLINDVLETSRELGKKDIEVNALYILMAHHFDLKQYDKTLFYGEKCLALAQEISNKSIMKSCNSLLYDLYKDLGNFELAIKYLENRTILETNIENIKANQKLQRVEIERYRMIDSLKSDKETSVLNFKHQLEIQQKNIDKNKLRIAWGGSLSLLSIFAFVIYRNSKQKQRQAEEDRQKQIEEKEKILKDLELSTIDAMIEGQEKERQRLASDLHDSVGATLSAAKMQFNYLIKHQNDNNYSEELIQKISVLLEDAYVEVRSMAHNKNAGVIAKNGLLPAVEKLSKNASGLDELTFEVKSFGLEKRLENTLEISVFRIIQELVTNIIKHAKASQGFIHLNNYDDNLNIMVEDNGIGFNSEMINYKTDGMGIDTIEKRVKYLQGKFTVESKKDKGTTIIIDIPL